MHLKALSGSLQRSPGFPALLVFERGKPESADS